MEKIDKITLFLYSVYALMRINKMNYLRLFDIIFFMSYLKLFFNSLEIISEEEIMHYTKSNKMCHLHIDFNKHVFIGCDKQKLKEFISNVTNPFLINVCEKAEEYWGNLGYCDNCPNLKIDLHKYKNNMTGIDYDLYCSKYNEIIKESILKDDIDMILKLKRCIKDEQKAK